MHPLFKQVTVFGLAILSVSGAMAAFVYQKQKVLIVEKKLQKSAEKLEVKPDQHWSVVYSDVGVSIPTAEKAPKIPEKTILKHGRTHYTLEVKTFKTRIDANAFIEQLSKQRIDSYFTPVQVPDGRVQYRVRSGLFPSLASAERISHVLKSKNIDNQVVKL